MSDLISRQDAIDAMGEEPPVWYDGFDEIAERNQWRRDKAAIESLHPQSLQERSVRNVNKDYAHTMQDDLISKQKTIDQLLADNDGIEREDAKAVMVCVEDVLDVID